MRAYCTFMKHFLGLCLPFTGLSKKTTNWVQPDAAQCELHKKYFTCQVDYLSEMSPIAHSKERAIASVLQQTLRETEPGPQPHSLN